MNMKKNICIGLLAHVDAGKTTLSESMLYESGRLKKPGRVDNQDAFLDTYALEKARGITIFSKQAVFSYGDTSFTLMDTPGHVDFSAEMERVLQVLDYAVLIINGADGIQGHTRTLWKLLERYQVPVFLFVNKMDQPGTDWEKLFGEITETFGSACVDFTPGQEREVFLENIAVCEERLMEAYLETGVIGTADIQDLIQARELFPCYFGSALKLQGVDTLLQGLDRYSAVPVYPEAFGARVYKIGKDDQGSRLTYLKITGGALRVKMPIQGEKQGEAFEEKVDQIRIYSGSRYEMISEAKAGTVCAVTGLTRTYAGQGLGREPEAASPVLEPVLTYQILLPEGCQPHVMLKDLQKLEEEEPQLHIVWNEAAGEIHAQVMGEIQIEILKSLILERFGVQVDFGAGTIVYKETIADTVEGVGHFEPLRHYAEVHLLLSPGERGSGITFENMCSEDNLAKNWQRLIRTHIREKEHAGVLTGSALTDVKITLLSGRAHLKHTEGGDFRQAAYRAVRQGLMQAKNVLLEPYFDFRLEVPAENVGRAMSDIQKRHGTLGTPEPDGKMAVLTGRVPVAAFGDYQKEVISYTRGRGKLSCTLAGYDICHNTEEVLAECAYDPDNDLDNPSGSVFCTKGAGYYVPWDQVAEKMHLPLVYGREQKAELQRPIRQKADDGYADEEELNAIFERTYGPVKQRTAPGVRKKVYGETLESAPVKIRKQEARESYLLVDGYNIIFAWPELKELAEVNINSARDKLMDILCNYQGYKKCTLILVFDAYKVEGNVGAVSTYHNIHVVYTKEAETADQYIEKTVHAMGRKYHVTVATSDQLEQVIILGQGGHLMSAADLKQEVELVNQQIRQELLEKKASGKNYLFHSLSEELADYMEEVRLGKKELE